MSTAPENKVPPVPAVRAVTSIINGMDKLQKKMLPPPVTISTMVAGSLLTSRAIYIGAELGLADELKAGPRSTRDLAAKLHVHEESLFRIMRALASLGILEEQSPRNFVTTALGKNLETDAPNSMRAWVRYVGETHHHELWGSLMMAVHNGKDLYQNKFGKRFFEYFAERPEEQSTFDEGMTSLSVLSDAPIAAAYDFSRIGSFVDIAGGYGGQLARILDRFPKLRGILFDQPDVIRRAKQSHFLRSNSARVNYESGSFFEKVPAGHDAYFMKSIIHDWEDASALKILQTIRTAIPNHGKLLLGEMVIEPGNDAHFGKLLDIAMLALTGGKERTEEEYRVLLRSAGFALTRILPTASPYSVIEALPV